MVFFLGIFQWTGAGIINMGMLHRVPGVEIGTHRVPVSTALPKNRPQCFQLGFWGNPQDCWMIYQGEFCKNGWFRATPIDKLMETSIFHGRYLLYLSCLLMLLARVMSCTHFRIQGLAMLLSRCSICSSDRNVLHSGHHFIVVAPFSRGKERVTKPKIHQTESRFAHEITAKSRNSKFQENQELVDENCDWQIRRMCHPHHRRSTGGSNFTWGEQLMKNDHNYERICMYLKLSLSIHINYI